jgi:ABC-type Fe3+-hydroxamate transport system substrate-binding protein
MNMRRTTIAATILFAALFILSVPMTGTADAAPGFEKITVTNSAGTLVTFDEPAQKVASLGLSFTTTLMGLDRRDDIVMIDNYSAPASSGLAGAEGIAYYPVGDGQMIAQILANGLGGFDRNRDVVFLYGYSYHTTAIQSMEAFGIKVVTFYPTNYEEGIDMVAKIGAIMGLDSKAADIVRTMRTEAAIYSEVLASSGLDKIRAAYVSYSGGTLRVGNVNSYSVILIKMAGGINAADDIGKTGSALTSYAVDDTMFIQMNVDVIFLDPYYAGTPDGFRAEKNISKNVKIYKLDMPMNQYGPTSLDGIKYMAKAMYPSVFGTPDQDEGGTAEDHIVYILLASAIASAITVGYVIIRR